MFNLIVESKFQFNEERYNQISSTENQVKAIQKLITQQLAEKYDKVPPNKLKNLMFDLEYYLGRHKRVAVLKDGVCFGE